MRSFDIFNEQIGRLEFAKKKCNGNILDVTYGDFLSYHTSKLLLNEGAKEVWSYDISESNADVYKRFFNNNNEIVIKSQGNPSKALRDEYFDCVISSETIQHSKNHHKEIELYYKILKQNGKLIISTSNKDAPKKIKSIQNEIAIMNEFSKDEFISLLSSKFQKIDLFSQRIIEENEIKKSDSLEKIRSIEKLRYFLAKNVKKIDREQKFYTDFISKIKYSKIINAKEISLSKEKKAVRQKYIPLKHNETHNPLFFILICYKG